jgi:hypothetical protein
MANLSDYADSQSLDGVCEYVTAIHSQGQVGNSRGNAALIGGTASEGFFDRSPRRPVACELPLVIGSIYTATLDTCQSETPRKSSADGRSGNGITLKQVKESERLGSCADALSAVPQVVNEDELAEVIEGGIVCPSLIRFREFLDEIDQVGIAGYHERADDDFLPTALDSFIKRLVDDPWIEAKRVLVEPSGIIEDR